MCMLFAIALHLVAKHACQVTQGGFPSCRRSFDGWNRRDKLVLSSEIDISTKAVFCEIEGRPFLSSY